MRGSKRLISLTVLLALSGALAGCGGGLSNFDPADMLDNRARSEQLWSTTVLKPQ